MVSIQTGPSRLKFILLSRKVLLLYLLKKIGEIIIIFFCLFRKLNIESCYSFQYDYKTVCSFFHTQFNLDRYSPNLKNNTQRQNSYASKQNISARSLRNNFAPLKRLIR